MSEANITESLGLPQDGLVSFSRINGIGGDQGPRTRLTYKVIPRLSSVLKETLILAAPIHLPWHSVATKDCKSGKQSSSRIEKF